MRKIVATIFACGMLTVTSAASANTLITSGKWQTKANWSEGHIPTITEQAIIPFGKEVKVEKSTTTGPVVDNGHIVGNQTLTVFGSIHLAPESFDLNGTLDMKGLGTITAEDTIYYLRLDGNETLSSSLHVGVLTAYRGSRLATNNHSITVDTETYPFEEAEWVLGTSTITTGYWLVFPESLEGNIYAEEASIIITGTGGGLKGVFKGEHWTYGNITFTGEGQSEGSYKVNGALAFDGNSTMEAGRIVTVGALTTTGTEEHPIHVTSPGSQIICGCTAPTGLILEGITLH